MSLDSKAEPNRRDFLYIATGTVATIGGALAAWPFIAQLKPDASVLALSTVEIDLSPIAVGSAITVKWRGNPVFIRHRTPQEIEAARAVKLEDLMDGVARNANLPEDAPATDENRVTKDHEAFLIMMAVCTHLGCVPIGDSGAFGVKVGPDQEGGWSCPCHGSQYDTSGRVRRSPAEKNLEVPLYQFLNEKRIIIGAGGNS